LTRGEREALTKLLACFHNRALKGDKQKVIMARRLRQETTMSLKWIAQRLQMGSWTYVFNLLNPKSQSTHLCK
jgi:hypothetical protein